jgi:hypothetical protein
MKSIKLKRFSAVVASGFLLLTTTAGFSAPVFATACDTAEPTVVATPVSQSGAAGDTLDYNLDVTNNDLVGCGNANFAFHQLDTPYSWGASVSSPVVYDIAPGQSFSVTVSYTSNQYALAGSYDLRVDTHKFFGSLPADQVANNTLTYEVVGAAPTDADAPLVSITAPANGATVKKNATTYISADAFDNIGVTQLDYWVNGQLVCSTAPGTACAWHVPNKRASFTIAVTAYDAVGNSATDTITVNAR